MRGSIPFTVFGLTAVLGSARPAGPPDGSNAEVSISHLPVTHAKVLSPATKPSEAAVFSSSKSVLHPVTATESTFVAHTASCLTAVTKLKAISLFAHDIKRIDRILLSLQGLNLIWAGSSDIADGEPTKMVASELSEASASAAIQSAYVEIIYLSLQSSALKSVDRKRQAASNVLIKSIQEGLVQLMNAQYKRTLPSAPLLNKRAVLVESGPDFKFAQAESLLMDKTRSYLNRLKSLAETREFYEEARMTDATLAALNGYASLASKQDSKLAASQEEIPSAAEDGEIASPSLYIEIASAAHSLLERLVTHSSATIAAERSLIKGWTGKTQGLNGALDTMDTIVKAARARQFLAAFPPPPSRVLAQPEYVIHQQSENLVESQTSPYWHEDSNDQTEDLDQITDFGFNMEDAEAYNAYSPDTEDELYQEMEVPEVIETVEAAIVEAKGVPLKSAAPRVPISHAAVLITTPAVVGADRHTEEDVTSVMPPARSVNPLAAPRIAPARVVPSAVSIKSKPIVEKIESEAIPSDDGLVPTIENIDDVADSQLAVGDVVGKAPPTDDEYDIMEGPEGYHFLTPSPMTRSPNPERVRHPSVVPFLDLVPEVASEYEVTAPPTPETPMNGLAPPLRDIAVSSSMFNSRLPATPAPQTAARMGLLSSIQGRFKTPAKAQSDSSAEVISPADTIVSAETAAEIRNRILAAREAFLAQPEVIVPPPDLSRRPSLFSVAGGGAIQSEASVMHEGKSLLHESLAATRGAHAFDLDSDGTSSENTPERAPRPPVTPSVAFVKSAANSKFKAPRAPSTPIQSDLLSPVFGTPGTPLQM